MSEEIVQPEVTEDTGIDMESALDSLSDGLFPDREKEVVENEDEAIEDDEVEEKEEKKQKAEKKPEKAKDDKKKEEKVEPEKTEKETKELAVERPASWKKDMQTTWDAMPKEAKDYVMVREEQMKQGLIKDRDDSNLGRVMRDTIAPFANVIKDSGADAPTMVRNMLGAHYKLSTASPEEKLSIFNKLAENYGVKFNGEGKSQEIDPAVKNLTNELNSIKSYLNQTQKATVQAATDKIVNEINAFASDPAHEYFDDVADEVAVFVSQGYELNDAYERAVRANPLTFQKLVDKLTQERIDTEKAKAEKKTEVANKAKSVNVKSRDSNKSPTATTGSMDDTLNETYRAINQRNRS